MSVNQIIVVGRLTKDVELRYTGNGKPVASFTVAVNRNYKTEDGETPTDFHGVTVWGDAAIRHSDYISKGKLVAVTGRLENNNYEDNDGNMRYGYTINAHDVQYLSPRPQEEAPPAPAAKSQVQRGGNPTSKKAANRQPTVNKGRSAFGHEVNLDDDIPF